MFSFLRFLNHVRKNRTVTNTEQIPVPDDILEIGWLYPVLHTLVGNKATGEIKLFADRDEKIGRGMIRNTEKEVWVYLGKHYFKNIVKL